MRVAVIGCGFMGQMHASSYNRMHGVELVGMCGFRQTEQKLVEETFQTAFYTSFDELLEEARPQIVSICLPTYLHKEYTVKAASAGVHVICEKPMASTLSDAEQMVDVCQQHGVKLFIAHVLRFFPSYQNIRQHIVQGAIGDLGMISTRRAVAHPGTDPHSWYNDDAKSGGVILDLMIHDTDLVSSLLGAVRSVYAMRRLTQGKQYALVTYKFANGTMANLEGLWGYPGPLMASCRVSGKKGVIRFDSGNSSSIRVHKTASNSSMPHESYLASPMLKDPYQEQLEHFVTCIRDHLQPVITVNDAYEALRLSLAANRSAELGRPIELSTFAVETEAGREATCESLE